MTKAHPKAKPNPVDVLARYGNWYQGDDDEFAHFFLLSDRRCVLLFQGLNTVRMSIFEAPKDEFDDLVALLDQPIPAGWPPASYAGYNFVTDAEGPDAKEIAVHGVQPGDTRPPGQYYAAPADSAIGLLVKAIAKVD
jgi:hypothetical protein